MTIRRYVLFIFLINGFLAQSQEAWTDRTRVLPDLLRKVPVALYIQHSPNPNYPEVNDTGDNKDMQYVWKHATTVCSPIKDLRVVKAGSFIWYDVSGWKENVQYSRKDFQQRFKCPKGKINTGSCFTFEKNYRWGNQLYGGDALWYVLAEDDNGTLYKGIGLIETETELNK